MDGQPARNEHVGGKLAPSPGSGLGLAILSTIMVIAACSTTGPRSTGFSETGEQSSLPLPTSVDSSTASPSHGSGPRTSPVVGGPVSERPGVPADLRDRYWFTDFGEAGHVGTTAYVLLPEGERVLDVDHGQVVSTSIGIGGGSTLVLRDLVTGTLRWSFDSQLRITSAAVIADRLFWAGRPIGVDGPADGGVWTVGLPKPEEPIQVLEPVGDMVAAGYVERGRFLVSPSERTIATVVGNMGNTHYDFIDTASLEVFASVEDRIVFGITDREAFAASGGDPPSSFPGLVAIDIETGEPTWRRTFDERAELAHVHVVANAVFVDFRLEEEQMVARLAIESGAIEVIHTANLEAAPFTSGVYLAPEISGPEHLVLLTEFSAGDAINASRTGQVAVDVLDVSTNQVERGAFEIGRP